MLRKIGILVFLLVSLHIPSVAQSDFGTLIGTGTVKGAKVIATETSSLRRHETIADENGMFSFPALVPGVYDLVAESAGRVISEMHGVSVSFGETVTLEMKLSTTTSYTNFKTISDYSIAEIRPGTGPALKFRSQALLPGRLGSNLAAQESTAGKEELSRLALASNGSVTVANNSSSNPLGGFSFNGISPEQNSVRIDGADVTPVIVLSAESFQDTAAFFLNMSKRQSLNAFKEFRIDDSNYPAVLGTGSGGKLITDTLKGNQAFRGDVYETFTDDALSARNYFDLDKPWLSYHLFGARFSGPLSRRSNSLFFFLNYEGIRARSEALVFEAIPSASARARAVSAVSPLLNAFYFGGATIVPGASNDPDLVLAKLESKNKAFKNFVTSRFTFEKPESKNALNFVYTMESSGENTPESVTGRRQVKEDRKQTAVVNFTRNSGHYLNELLFAFSSAPSRLGARVTEDMPPELSGISVNVSATLNPVNVPGQPLPLSLASPGGLLRKNRSATGRGTRTTPSSFSVIDQLKWTVNDKHLLTVGGEFRFLSTYLNVFNGINYRFASLEDLLQNRPSTVQLSGDLGNPSPFGASGKTDHRATQQYSIGFIQERWLVRPNMSLTTGLRYEYYSVVREDRDRNVVFDIVAGTVLSADNRFYKPSKANFLPRVALAWAPHLTTPTIAKNSIVVTASFGIHSGASGFRDQIKPIENDRIDVTQIGGVFPTPQSTLEALFFNNPNTRQYQPLAFDPAYRNAEKAFKYDVSLKKRLSGNENSEFYLLASYVGTAGRDLLLRYSANRITRVDTNPDPTRPAVVLREFDIFQGGNVLKPFGEIDVRSSKGWSRYDSLQLRMNGAFPKANIFLLDVQYTFGRSIGNTNGGSQTGMTANPFDLDYDRGLSLDDVKHKFSLSTVYALPIGANQMYFRKASGIAKQLLSNWTLGGRVDIQGGKPIDVRLTRPDIVYVDATGQVFSSPAVGRVARINVPGGGASFNVQRPDLVPGADPYLSSDRRLLNPAAFAIPAPGNFGNLTRGKLRGPGLALVDLSIKKRFTGRDGIATFDFRCDITNLFNHTNFDRPQATLPNALGVGSNLLQPGQPFNSTIAPTFGVLNRTFKREQDFGASRQIQFSFVIYLNGGSTKL